MIWCLHGAVGMAADWNEFAERLGAAGHEVRAVDLWEFGAERNCSFEEFGKALWDRVRDDDPEPVVLGYSLGGRLALHALLEEDAGWTAGVIVSAHPGLASEKERILRMAEDAQWAAEALQGDWDRFLERWKAQGVLRDGGTRGLGDRGALEERREAVARGFMDWSLGKQEDLRPRLREVGVPVLWVTGADDGKFTELAREATAELDTVRHEVIDGAGHRLPWERPEDFAALVRAFRAG